MIIITLFNLFSLSIKLKKLFKRGFVCLIKLLLSNEEDFILVESVEFILKIIIHFTLVTVTYIHKNTVYTLTGREDSQYVTAMLG